MGEISPPPRPVCTSSPSGDGRAREEEGTASSRPFLPHPRLCPRSAGLLHPPRGSVDFHSRSRRGLSPLAGLHRLPHRRTPASLCRPRPERNGESSFVSPAVPFC